MVDVKFLKNKVTNEITMVLNNEEPKENEVVLKANDTDATVEKHVPVIEQNGNDVIVTVGSVLHPMTPAHYITMIVLVTDKKATMVKLTPEAQPKACFSLEEGEKVVAAYEYCNLHGLWVKKVA